jgi:nitronate monooxygenase
MRVAGEALNDLSPWPDRRIQHLLGIDVPIIQAPMAGVTTKEMIVAVTEEGGLGSLPLGMATAEEAQVAVERLDGLQRCVNLNFFCHRHEPDDPIRERAWRVRLQPFFAEMGLEQETVQCRDSSFGSWQCKLIERVRPKVVSFHFGLPDPSLLRRVKATGAKVLCTATTVREARFLEVAGCDAIIAQGLEAGGHRGSFLDVDLALQSDMMALVQQIVDAVRVPVIAAGGIGDARGIATALALGAAAVQLGTAYLFTPEARVSLTFREGLRSAAANGTVITNALSGAPARALCNRLVHELGTLVRDVPRFPVPACMLRRLAQAADFRGRSDLLSVWCGQGAPLCSSERAAVLTRRLAKGARELLAAA